MPGLWQSVRDFRQGNIRCHLFGIEQLGPANVQALASFDRRLPLLSSGCPFRIAGLYLQSGLRRMSATDRYRKSFSRPRHKRRPDFDRMISVLYTTRQLHPAGANAKQCYRVYISTRAAACGGRARLQGAAGLRRREAAARTAFSRPKFKIQDSRFKIQN